MKKLSLLWAVGLTLIALPALAQYGVGEEVTVAHAPDGAITLDGVRSESFWDLGAQFDPLTNYDFYTSYATEPDLATSASVLWGSAPAGVSVPKSMQDGDWLYVFVEVLDNDIFIPDPGDAWQADQILLGIDPTHAGDSLYDGDFAGGVFNAPTGGPYAYKIWPDGITLNWGFDGVVPTDSGWVVGTVYRDSTTLTWGVELAAYVGEAPAGKSAANRQIGFNIGGAQAGQGALDAGESEATYGFFSQYVCDISGEPCTYAGGSVMSDARSFATLTFQGGGDSGGDYGVGVEVDVTHAPDGAITLDGERNEAVWDLGAQFDPIANYDFYTSYASEPDLASSASVLWGSAPAGVSVPKSMQDGDWLYVYVEVLDNDIFIPDPGDAWQADQILVGIDPTHEDDVLYDGDFAGGVANAPDKGSYAYKVWPVDITLNWGFDGVVPTDSGWVVGTVFRDSTTLIWGVEMAAYIGEGAAAKAGAARQIGFNIGGAQAGQGALDAGESEATYGYFSQYVCDISGEACTYAGGAVMSDARSFATLNLLGEGGSGSDYGVGVETQVPNLANVGDGTITLDGVGDESGWQEAPLFDPIANYDFYTSFVTEPDLASEARVLWGGPPEGSSLAGDWLYVYVHVYDNEIYIPDPGDAWMADQILVGIDPTHADDVLYDGDFAGGVANAPDKGSYAYKIWPDGITLNWGFDGVEPADSGWVVGTVFRDSTTLEWGVEFAAYMGEAAAKTQEDRLIGFNVGGAQASQAALDAGESEATYGYFSQYVCDISGEACTYAGGAVMSDARSFATLKLVQNVDNAIEEEPVEGVPAQFRLSQNYPNPFNPTTTIEFGLPQAARASIDVYNTYGQRIATLMDGQHAAGNYRVSWDAAGLPSGTYLYQLRVDGSIVESHTMVLIK